MRKSGVSLFSQVTRTTHDHEEKQASPGTGDQDFDQKPQHPHVVKTSFVIPHTHRKKKKKQSPRVRGISHLNFKTPKTNAGTRRNKTKRRLSESATTQKAAAPTRRNTAPSISNFEGIFKTSTPQTSGKPGPFEETGPFELTSSRDEHKWSNSGTTEAFKGHKRTPSWLLPTHIEVNFTASSDKLDHPLSPKHRRRKLEFEDTLFGIHSIGQVKDIEEIKMEYPDNDKTSGNPTTTPSASPETRKSTRSRQRSVYLLESLVEAPETLEEKKRARERITSKRGTARGALKAHVDSEIAKELERMLFVSVTFGKPYDSMLHEMLRMFRSDPGLHKRLNNLQTATEDFFEDTQKNMLNRSTSITSSSLPTSNGRQSTPSPNDKAPRHPPIDNPSDSSLIGHVRIGEDPTSSSDEGDEGGGRSLEESKEDATGTKNDGQQLESYINQLVATPPLVQESFIQYFVKPGSATKLTISGTNFYPVQQDQADNAIDGSEKPKCEDDVSTNTIPGVNVHVRLFSTFFHPRGVVEPDIIVESPSEITAKIPGSYYPSLDDDIELDKKHYCQGCESCVGVPLYAIVMSHGTMSDAIQVASLSNSPDGLVAATSSHASPSEMCTQNSKEGKLGGSISLSSVSSKMTKNGRKNVSNRDRSRVLQRAVSVPCKKGRFSVASLFRSQSTTEIAEATTHQDDERENAPEKTDQNPQKTSNTSDCATETADMDTGATTTTPAPTSISSPSISTERKSTLDQPNQSDQPSQKASPATTRSTVASLPMLDTTPSLKAESISRKSTISKLKHKRYRTNDLAIIPAVNRGSVLNYRLSVNAQLQNFARFSGDPNISIEAVTRGTKKINEDIDKAEEFLEQLPEVTFDVIKVNLRGRRQERRIRLTKIGIDNIRKKNNIVSSSHPYETIIVCSLKNLDELVISLENYHDLTYCSESAPDIVNAINRRLKVLQTTEKRKFASDLSLEFQKKWEDEEERRKELTRRISTSTSDVEAGSFQTNRHSESLSEDVEREMKVKEKLSLDQLLYSKLASLTGETTEGRISFAIDRLLLSQTTDEGRARNTFHKKFPQYEKTQKTVCNITRQFMNQLKAHINEKHYDELIKLVQAARRMDEDGADLNSRLLSYIEASVERAVVMPVRDKLLACIKQSTADDNELLMQKIQLLRDKSQDFYGIVEPFVSPNNWASAVYELGFLEKMTLPSQKVKTLVLTAKAIYNSYNYERRKRNKNKKKCYLAGDDFLPICIYVVVQSKAMFSEVTKTYLLELCDPSALVGEQGYYLTAFEAALEYIKSADVEAMQTQFEEQKLEKSKQKLEKTRRKEEEDQKHLIDIKEEAEESGDQNTSADIQTMKSVEAVNGQPTNEIPSSVSDAIK